MTRPLESLRLWEGISTSRRQSQGKYSTEKYSCFPNVNLLCVLGCVGAVEILCSTRSICYGSMEKICAGSCSSLLLKSNGCISTASARYEGDLSIHLLILTPSCKLKRKGGTSSELPPSVTGDMPKPRRSRARLIFWTLGPNNRFQVCMVRRRVASEKRGMAVGEFMRRTIRSRSVSEDRAPKVLTLERVQRRWRKSDKSCQCIPMPCMLASPCASVRSDWTRR